ncbi:MAG: cation-translocating P-type ATPase [Bacteroidales bacterium]|nr:cation-translocating P-type ATPase [Bacteroidales bacterium]MBO5131527.1 cation-translocating P-type ATPase [Paludibacteraceae bacterium]
MKKRDLLKLPRLRFYGSMVISLFLSWLYGFSHGLNNLSVLLFVGVTFQIALFSKSLYHAFKIGVVKKIANVGGAVVISIFFTWIGTFFLMLSFMSEKTELACFIFISWLVTFYLLGCFWVVILHRKEFDLELPDVLPRNVHVVLDNGVIVEVEAQNVVSGDRIKVYSGEVVPFDGEIIVGTSFVDESLLSGRSLFVTKQKGDAIFAGTTNKGGAIVFEVRMMGSRSKYVSLVEKVKDILARKKVYEDDFEHISPVYVGVVVSFWLILLVFWIFFNLSTSIFLDLYFLVSVLIVACPIFLKLSTPAILFYASYLLKRIGFSVKNVFAIPNIAKIDAIVLDKKCWDRGSMSCMRVAWNETEEKQSMFLSLIASICQEKKQFFSQILQDSLGEDVQPSEVKYKSEYSSDCGEIVSFNDETYLLGTRKFLLSHSISLPRSMGKTDLEVYWIVNNRVSAIFYLPESRLGEKEEWMSLLRSHGIELYLMSAESESHTKKMAERLSIISYISNADAEDKLELVKNLQSQGKRVLVMGVSLGDLLALAQADVSVAFSDSSQISSTLSDLVLGVSKMSLLADLILFSKQVKKRIKWGNFFAYLIPILAMILVSGLLYCFFQIIILGEIALAMFVLGFLLLLINTLNQSIKSHR